MPARSLCLTLCLALCLALGACSTTPPADTLYTGAHILTMDPATAGATAVAVTGERITFVGDRADFHGSAKRHVELGERALLPGFIDAHGHLFGQIAVQDLALLASPPVGPVTDIPSLQAALRAHRDARDLAPGAWLVGYGYDESLLAEQRHPTRQDLDAVSTEHPIFLQHVSGHLGAANSLALAQVGFGPDSADPPGGVIRREAGSRQPNGVLEETAAFAVRALLPQPSLDRAAVERALATYASHGITTVQDGASSWPAVAALQALAAEAPLSLDVLLYPLLFDPAAELPATADFGSETGGVRLAGIKLMLDGSPQGKTAWMTAPYLHPPHGQGADYRGYPTLPPATIHALALRARELGAPVIAHANGDAAADLLLDAVADADAALPNPDHRTVMIHAQTVREDQLDRMQALGVLPSYFSAHTFFWGDWHRDEVFGPARALRISPTASTLQRGMRFTVHNDAPIVPPDMLRLLWATVNRQTRSGQVLGADQRIPVLEALRAMTAHGAFQSFDETRKGSLTPGKQADLVVLSANPLTLAAEQLLDLRVEETVARGQRVHRAR